MCSISLLLFALAFTWTLVSAVPYPVLPSFSSFTKAAKEPILGKICPRHALMMQHLLIDTIRQIRNNSRQSPVSGLSCIRR